MKLTSAVLVQGNLRIKYLKNTKKEKKKRKDLISLFRTHYSSSGNLKLNFACLSLTTNYLPLDLPTGYAQRLFFGGILYTTLY